MPTSEDENHNKQASDTDDTDQEKRGHHRRYKRDRERHDEYSRNDRRQHSDSYRHKQVRRSRSRSPVKPRLIERREFDIKFLVESDFVPDMTRFSFLQSISKSNGCDEVSVDSDKHPDGAVVVIKSNKLAAKTDAFYALMSHYFSLHKESKKAVIIFVPERLVPIVIGHKGR